jgi:hypothetical protein
MLTRLREWWMAITFDALVRHRTAMARQMIEKHRYPTPDEKHQITRLMAEALVTRNLGTLRESEVLRIQERVVDAREGIAKMFQHDGHSPDFSAALAQVCVAWDYDTYKNRRWRTNLTLNYLKKVHTPYAWFFQDERMPFPRDGT